MKIQHNIPAMNAYRNYTNNVSAVAKNLEKLSSGYRINRAGDDAAGLAISEKMRAQITGLATAQKNAKDGISLIQTAEGAMTEVHSMLNRMFELAEQSANGTYDNEVDRANLQKEFNALRTEIDRIADSSNFNGKKLLDGTLDGTVASTTLLTDPKYNAASPIPPVDTGKLQGDLGSTKVTILNKESTPQQEGIFKVELNDLDFKGTAGDLIKIKVGDLELEVAATGSTMDAEAIAAAFAAKYGAAANAGDVVFNDKDTNAQQFKLEAVKNEEGGKITSLQFTQINKPTVDGETVALNMEVKITATADPNAAPAVGSPELGGDFATDIVAGGLIPITEQGSNSWKATTGPTIATTTLAALGADVSAENVVVGGSVAVSISNQAGEDAILAILKDKGTAAGDLVLAFETNHFELQDVNGNMLAKTGGPAGSINASTQGSPIALELADGTVIGSITFNNTTGDSVDYDTMADTTLTSGLNYTKEKANASQTLAIGTETTSLDDILTMAKAKGVTEIKSGGAIELVAGTDANLGKLMLSVDGKEIAELELNANGDKYELKYGGRDVVNVTIAAGDVIDLTAFAAFDLGKTLEGGGGTPNVMSMDTDTATAETNLLAAAAKANITNFSSDMSITMKLVSGKVKLYADTTEIGEADPANIKTDGKLTFKYTDASGTATDIFTLSTTAGTTVDVASWTSDVDTGLKLGLGDPPSATGPDVKGTYSTGTNAIKQSTAPGADQLASTTFSLTADMIKDGGMIELGGEKYVFKNGADSVVPASMTDATVIDLTGVDEADLLRTAGDKLTEAAETNKVWDVGHDATTGLIKLTEIKGQTASEDKLTTIESVQANVRTGSIIDSTAAGKGKALSLQIGDTSESFNMLRVSVGDMHADSLGKFNAVTDDRGNTSYSMISGESLDDVKISDQDSAASAMDVIKGAINMVSSTRGDLGALQNRLEHTINNLGVMEENIQDAESSIRDTDIAKEMMAYTKNNILVQASQAMLAQANQLPQGVLQLLG